MTASPPKTIGSAGRTNSLDHEAAAATGGGGGATYRDLRPLMEDKQPPRTR
jgi:hypothetical protein